MQEYRLKYKLARTKEAIDKSQRIISRSGAIRYDRKEYYIDYRKAGQKVTVREGENGDLHVYQGKKLIKKIKKDG